MALLGLGDKKAPSTVRVESTISSTPVEQRAAHCIMILLQRLVTLYQALFLLVT
jgi:hypothetical protein